MRFYLGLSFLSLALLSFSACEPISPRYGDTYGGPYDGRYGDRYRDRYEARSDRRDGDWVTLGRREVDFRNDRDRIEVGRSDGTFRALRVTVRGAPIEMNQMVVTFGDGSKFNTNVRHNFDENSSSRVIDLPGDRRFISHVDFNYRSVSRREGKATVVLQGR